MTFSTKFEILSLPKLGCPVFLLWIPIQTLPACDCYVKCLYFRRDTYVNNQKSRTSLMTFLVTK